MKTTKLITFGISLLFLSLVLISCGGGGGRVLPAATGARFEILIVMDNAEWQAPAGRAIFNLFNQDMPGLPQPEPMFNITQVRHADFISFLRPSRNILVIEVSPERFTHARINYSRDRFSRPQSFVHITVPDEDSLLEAINTHGENVLNYFVVTERERIMQSLTQRMNRNASQEILEHLGVQVNIPPDMRRSTSRENFFWITNDHHETLMNIVIYTYPYTDPNTFTYEFLIAKRDTIMKRNIPGQVSGSFMGTERQFATPIMREIAHNGEYAVEIIGLWRTMNGGAMGGPFYSLTRLDEVNQRIVTIEGFLFAPGVRKRNAIRTLEAVVHSIQLPQDMNRIEEISVIAPRITEE